MTPLLLATIPAVVYALGGPQRSTEAVVAAIVHTGNGDDWDAEIICDDEEEGEREPCEVEDLIRGAADRGASLVVVSEAAFEESRPEHRPIVGRRPPRAGAPVQARFGELAEELGLYVVIQLETETSRGTLYSTQIALDPRGIVVAKHDKLELYDGERELYGTGTDVHTFDTPFGRVGMLICSDLYSDPRYHERLVGELGADIVALSSIWTVADATRWQSAFARDWGVVLIAANGAASDGVGAGIYDRSGEPLQITRRGTNTVLTTTLP